MERQAKGKGRAMLAGGGVPAVSLDGRKPSSLKMPELKQWLLSRGASTKGKKANLVAT